MPDAHMQVLTDACIKSRIMLVPLTGRGETSAEEDEVPQKQQQAGGHGEEQQARSSLSAQPASVERDNAAPGNGHTQRHEDGCQPRAPGAWPRATLPSSRMDSEPPAYALIIGWTEMLGQRVSLPKRSSTCVALAARGQASRPVTQADQGRGPSAPATSGVPAIHWAANARRHHREF